MKNILGCVFTLAILGLSIPSLKAQSEEKISFENYQGYVIHPANPDGRWIWVFPAWLRDTGVLDFYITTAINDGMTVVGLETGVTLGSPVAAALNHRFFEHVRDAYHLNKKTVLLLQSNGNTSGIAWARRHAKNVSRILGIFPVFDLRDWPKVEQISQLINPAFAYPLGKLNAAQPIKHLASLAREHVPFFVMHGDRDTVVNFFKNSLRAKFTYQQIGGKFTLKRIAGLDHIINPEFHGNSEAAAFLVGK